MSYPIVYSDGTENFENNGLGVLPDCISCVVSETKNGEYELSLEYPVSGIHCEDIKSRSIIKAKPNQIGDPQLFRVYSIVKKTKRSMVVKAEHISYDLSGIPVSPFYANGVLSAFSTIKNDSAVYNPFEFWTDKSDAGEFKTVSPMSARAVLGEVASMFGGDFEFDNFLVKLHSKRGSNRGVSIRYGKNLTSLKQDENCSSVITGIYPYWIDSNGSNLVQLSEKIINAPGTYNFERVKTVDFSSYFSNKPTTEQLKNAAIKYMEENNVGVPEISITVSFAQLDQTGEYAHLALLERVSIGDIVNVEFPSMGVSADAEAVKVVYNVLLDRVDSVSLGSVKNNIVDTIVSQKKELEKTQKKSQLQIAIDQLTQALLGANGGSVRLIDENQDGMPDTLYIADDPDPALAKKVWRFNYEGWGASKNGYVGPFEIGASFDSGILAEFITAGTLYGMLIKAGMIESESGAVRIDLSTDKSAIFNTGISTNGLYVRNKQFQDRNLISLQHLLYNEGDFSSTEFIVGSGNSDGHNLFTAVESGYSGASDSYMTLESAKVGSKSTIVQIDASTTGSNIEVNTAKRNMLYKMNLMDVSEGGGVVDRYGEITLEDSSDGAMFNARVEKGEASLFLSKSSGENENFSIDLSDLREHAKATIGYRSKKVELTIIDSGVLLELPGRDAKKISFRKNDDGTYTLIGEDV